MFRLIASLLITAFSSTAFANVIGTDAQNFNPVPDGLDYVTVQSSKTLEPWQVNLGLFLNYATNTFPAYEGVGTAPSTSVLDKNDSITSADFNFGLGITRKWQIGLSFPYLVDQTIEDDSAVGQFANTGFTEYRFNTKYSFREGTSKHWGFASIFTLNHNRIKNNPYVGTGGSDQILNLEFVTDKRFGRYNFAINVGHRWRDPGAAIANFGIEPYSNQWIASTALSRRLESIDTKLIGEIYGSYPSKTTQNQTDRQESSLEFLFGVKHDWTTALALHAGVGTELAEGTSTPDARVYGGLNYAFQRPQEKPLERIETTERIERFVLPDLNFEFNSTNIVDSSKRALNELIKYLQTLGNNIKSITVEGHTDSVGSESYNLSLSERRAKRVVSYLETNTKIPPGIINAVGYGESKPVASNENYRGRLKNRRVEIVVEKKTITTRKVKVKRSKRK